MRSKVTLLLTWMIGTAFLQAQTSPQHTVVTPHIAAALRFTENLGQWNDRVLFRAHLPGGQLFVENSCLTFNFYDIKKVSSLHMGGLAKGEQKDFSIRGHAFRVRFEGANTLPRVEKRQEGKDYENFYIGKDTRKWKSGVRNYSQVLLRELYNGIDYELLAAGKSVKYNFHVKPGTDPRKIGLRYEGVSEMKIVSGALHIRTTVNEITEEKPYAYQVIGGSVVEVPCQYRLSDGVLGFVFPRGYDRAHALVIDPILVFSAQIGSVADNFGMTATFDQAGNLYSGGVVYDAGYPYVSGSYDNSFSGPPAYGNTDVFITKYNATGNALIFSTYLGGSFTEVVSSLIVDGSNNLCLYGATGSTDFPVSTNAADPSFNGGSNIGFISNGSIFDQGSDIYITKFNSSGTALLGSTFFGGSGNDGINYLAGVSSVFYPGIGTINTCGYDSLLTNYGDQYRGEIQIDSIGNIYIVSSTRSGDLPINGGFDNSLGGAQDAVVAKYNSGLTTLLYSTYLGGSLNDCGNGIFVTPNFEIYATGGTCANNFPGTSGSHSPSYNGGKSDGFLSRIAASGTLVQSTYIGTAQYDNSFFVQCDKYGSVYVYGQSLGNIPLQAYSNLPLYNVPGTHQFIREYNTALTGLQMSTVFGSKTNGLDISPSAFAIDECNGNIYLSGWGGGLITNTVAMSNMPLLNPNQNATNGHDFYLMALKPHASSQLYGSYYGGLTSYEHVDGGTSRFDRKGIIYQSVCAGCGGYDDFPISNGAWPCPGSSNCPNRNFSSNCNNGVFKINFDLQKPKSTITTNTTSGCAPLTLTFTNTNPGTSYMWDLGNGNTTSVIPSPVVTFTNPGTYLVNLLVVDTTLCIRRDSTYITINVQPGPSVQLTVTPGPCTSTVALNYVSSFNTTSTWNYGDGSGNTSYYPVYTYTTGGIYNISVSATSTLGCKTTKSQTVSVLDFAPSASPSASLCYGASYPLLASGGTQYSWQPAASLSSSNAANPVANPTASTVYTVNILNTSFGQNCAAVYTLELLVRPSPTTDFSYTVHPCGGVVYFTDLSASDIASRLWTFPALKTSTVMNPVHNFSIGGQQNVVLETTNIFGCRSTKSKQVEVKATQVGVSDGVNICLGGNTQLYADGGVVYQWIPPDGLDNPYAKNPVASPTITTDYSVIITAATTNTATGGPCEYTLTTNVKVSQLSVINPVGAMANPTVITRGEQTTLVYTGDPGALVVWQPPGSTTPGTGYTVTASPGKPTTYTALASREACGEAVEVYVMVYSDLCVPGEIFIPNTFTPNGDGENDIFRVRGLSVDEVYFAIYNRWGEMVYETNERDGGWDGRYKGRDADVGVFGWYLKVKCFNGEETFMKGNVTLIR
jgi:gliding motility-associated-like protein